MQRFKLNLKTFLGLAALYFMINWFKGESLGPETPNLIYTWYYCAV